MKYILSILVISSLFTSCASKKFTLKQKKARIYYSHGTSQLLEKNYTEALKNLMKADELDPNNSETLNNLGMAYYFKARPNIALKHINRALKIDPKNSDARNNLASIYLNQGKIQEAKRHYTIVLNDLVYKQTFRVHYNLGLIALKENNPMKAISHLEKASGLIVDYCAANYRLGKTYELVNKLAKSLKAYKAATQGECRKHPEPFYSMATVYERLGRASEALETYEYIMEKFSTHRLGFLATRKKALLQKKDKFTKNSKRDKVETFNSGDF